VQLLKGEFRRGDLVEVFMNDDGEIDFRQVEGGPLPVIKPDVNAHADAE